MKTKVSDLVAEFLEKKNIKVAFGIIGSANSHIFDSITKRGFTKIVCVHHEQAAVMAMQGYYRTCGELSVAIVTAGAGSSNAITGVLSAWADSIPGIIISGQEPSRFLVEHKDLRMYGIQGFNSTKMVSDITKYAKCMMEADAVQFELEHAYEICLSGRPGPVWLDFPFDIQSKMVDTREWADYIDTKVYYVDDKASYFLECLEQSQRPVIIAGRGVKFSGATESFQTLIDQFRVPTIISWAAIDLLPSDNPYFYGRAGLYGQRCANFVVQNSDLILVLGSRMSLTQVGYNIKNYAPNAKIFLVDIDENESKKYEGRLHRIINCDVSSFIFSLLYDTNKKSFFKRDWINQCNTWKLKYPWVNEEEHSDRDGFINSYKFMELLSEYMKDDQVIVTDMGTALLSGHQAIKLKKTQKMFTSTGLGEMGFGLPGAIGAAFANKGEVLCLNCDGGMMMNLQELQTIITHNLPIKIVVFNNDGYLMIKHTENMIFGGNRFAVDKATGVSLPDYGRLGTALGFNTYTIRDWADFHKVMPDFINSPYPCICEVFMHPEQDFIPKVKGAVKEDGTIMPGILEEMSPLLPLEEIEEQMIGGINEISKQIKR